MMKIKYSDCIEMVEYVVMMLFKPTPTVCEDDQAEVYHHHASRRNVRVRTKGTSNSDMLMSV